MSSNFLVRLKKKRQSYKNSIVLFDLTTTPTRELCDEISFVYCGGRTGRETEEELQKIKDSEYGDYTVLDNELLDSVIDYYDQKIEDDEKTIKDNISKLIEKKKDILLVKSVDIYNEMSEEINDLPSFIQSEYEDIKENSYYRQCFSFAKQIVEDFDNKDYELIYWHD